MTMCDGVRVSELIGPAYHDVHRDIRSHGHTHYVFEGGRGSLKSSFISMEVALLLKRNPRAHAVVFRKLSSDIGNSVFPQYQWALDRLGIGHEFLVRQPPRAQLIYRHTGQRILFMGGDGRVKLKDKAKSIKLPFGYIGITHFEEKDQFDGRDEIRSILQSTQRGGDLFWNFESNNPPISKASWANVDSMEARPGRLLHKSDYRSVPPEWLGEQFLMEAEYLRDSNPRAYEHEYLGVPTGTGGDVFENLCLDPIPDELVNQFDQVHMGVDWGYFPDPFAWNCMYYDPARLTLYVFDELTALKCGNEETARQLVQEKGVTGSDVIYADSAEPKSIGDYREFGIACYGVVKGKGSVAYRMKWMQRLQKIWIDPVRCPETAREFSTYEYDRARDGTLLNRYPDKDNHHIDAVSYGMWPVWKQKGY